MSFSEIANIFSNREEVLHATSNSKEVRDGGIFIARKGLRVDGNDFIQEAIKNGASYIFCSQREIIKPQANVEFFLYENLEEELPNILKQIYRLPERIIAITGTNGKTSTAFFAAQVFSFYGKPAGFIGTLGVLFFNQGAQSPQEQISKTSLTTPDSVSLFYNLALLKEKGAEFVFFEASSIGLVQGRIDGVPLAAACFTNFTQDHLDFHHTMEEYFQAKALLFSKYLQAPAFAVLNRDDLKIYGEISKICLERGIKFLTNDEFGPINPKYSLNKITFDTKFFKGGVLNLSGKFQLENIMFVIALLAGFGFDLAKLKDILPLLKAPKGRLEQVESSPKSPNVFVDYAHTPDSLLKALNTLNDCKTGKLIVVFGCGGERDKIKRKIMGEIATQNADFAIITEDNPRGEDPARIRKEIISGISGKNFREVAGREEAIEVAIKMASPKDVILVAGKGHEDYQIIGDKTIAFDDVLVTKNILSKL